MTRRVGADRTARKPELPAALSRWFVVCVVLVGFGLRAYRLAAQSLWSDEDITLDRAGQPLAELIGGLPVEHAPLYFVLVRLWALVAGDGDLALRFPSLAFGVLAIPLGAYVGRRLVGPRGGLVAAVLLAVSPFLVWYGQEARMYSLVAALSLAAVAAVLRAEDTGHRRWWVASGAMAALCVYAHYYGVLLVAVLTVWAALDIVVGRRRALVDWLVAGLTALLLFAPWLPRALRVAEFPGWRDPEPIRALIWSAAVAWSSGTTGARDMATWAVVLYLSLAVVGVLFLIARAVRAARDGHRRLDALRLLSYLAVPLVIVALMLLREPDFHPRYFFAALPAVYLVVAAGAAALPRPATLLVTVLLVAAAVVPLARLYGDPSVQKQDYRTAIRMVESAAGERDGLARASVGAGDEDADEFGDTTLLLDGPPFGMMERYRSADSLVRIVNLRSRTMSELSAEERDVEIARRAASYPQIWVATDGGASGDVAAWLDAHAFPVDQATIQNLTLSRYYYPGPGTDDGVSEQTGSGGGEDSSGSSVAGQSGLGLSGLPVGATVAMPSEVTSGNVLPVALSWRPTASDLKHLAEGDLKVAVRLVGPSGGSETEVARADRRPVNWTRPTSSWQPGEIIIDRHGLLVPADAPPGEYAVAVVMYLESDPGVSWEARLDRPVTVRDEVHP